MEPTRENKQISNRFYNFALDRAKSRDLFGATILLKKALKFNKQNFNARNLLALILFEEGAVVEAIVELLVSRDVVKTDLNYANEYIEEIQNDENLQKFWNLLIK